MSILKKIKRKINLLLRNQAGAERYVGSSKNSGRVHFELLKMEGCGPESQVLEIGCGYLLAAVLIIEYLNENKYVGIDPNEWLRKAAMRDPAVAQLIQNKKALFRSDEDFDASSTGRSFNYIFSHSVLSHCAHWQLPLFLQNTKKVLAQNGRILASIRLAEGNAYGSPGTPDKQDSNDATWQYPGVSWFSLRTVQQEAARCGLKVELRPSYTEYFMGLRQKDCHDWLVFSHQAD